MQVKLLSGRASTVNVKLLSIIRDVFYGAQTTLYCVLDDDVMKHSGGYFMECKHTELQSYAINETARGELWNLSSKLTVQSIQ